MAKIQPERRCVTCRQRFERSALLRVVRRPTGEVVVATQPQHMGRSAYVCRNAECVGLALKRNAFQRTLKVTLPDGVKAQLEKWLAGSGIEPAGEQSKASDVMETFN